jgi:hypothetical protein
VGLRRANGLTDFNFEQMASVIEDAYRLRHGFPTKWLTRPSVDLLPLYLRFIHQLREGKGGG